MKRWKKILKWTAVAFGALIAILLIANAIFVGITDSRLSGQLAEIKSAGEPLSLADLARKPIPPDANAATYLRRAEADVTAIESEIEQWRTAHKDPNFWDYLYSEWDYSPSHERRPMPEEMRKAINAIYAAHPRAIPLLRQGADCPDYDAQLDYTLPPDEFIAKLMLVVSGLRNDARVLRYRSRLLLLDGEYEEAARLGLVNFKLARHAERSPLVIGYLVALTIQGMAVDSANQVLQAGPVSKEVHQLLDAELALQERMDGLPSTIKSERAFLLDTFRSFPRRNFWLGIRGYWNRQESSCLDVLKTFLTLAERQQSNDQAGKSIWKSNAANPPIAASGALASQLMPSWQAICQAIMRVQSTIRCLRVVNALQTYVAVGSSATPNLSDLGLPAATTTDPFNGQPLHLKKTPQGWVVYSVGRNERDDGGNLDMHDLDNCDFGVGPPVPVAKDDKK
jgi:hypothetical protein